MKRAVFLEKSRVEDEDGIDPGHFGIFHYAVKVGYDDWYEIDAGGGWKTKENIINYLFRGKPRSFGDRPTRKSPALTCAGATDKTDADILVFNSRWMTDHPDYNAILKNCQTYAFNLIKYLVGGSFKMTIPLTSGDAWAKGPGCHEVDEDGYYQARATTGKAGFQVDFLAAEAEGPSTGADISEFYAGAEVSVGRVELQVLGVGARFELNLNTGIGVTDRQFKAKAAGFGVTLGKGFAVHTPLGSLGFGRF